MNEQLRVLIELQAVDDLIADLKKKLAAIPEQIDRYRAGYLREQKALEELKASIETGSRERRAAERELEAMEEKIRKLKEQQFMVKTNKEYQTFLHEIEGMEQKKGSLEEAVLVLMEDATEADRRIKTQQQAVIRAKEDFGREEGRLKSEEAVLQEQLAQAETRQSAIVSQVSAEHLRHYSRLREFHHGKAVAAVLEGICQGCFIALRPQRYQEAKRNEAIITCDQCKRIIYRQESPSAAQPPPSQEE